MFTSNSTWNQYATTFADQSQIRTLPWTLYIDTKNSTEIFK